MVLQRGADAALERLLNLPVIQQIEGIPEPEQLEQRPEPFPRRLRLVRRRAEVQPSFQPPPVEPLFPRRLRLVRRQAGVQPPPPPPQPPISPVSAKVTPSRFFPSPPPEEELPEEEPEVTFGANPTFWLWKRKLLPEFMFSSMDAQRDIRAGQEGLPGIKRVEDIEARRREELARDPNPLIRLANTPTVVGGLTPADFVGLGLIAYGGYVSVRSLIPVTKELANKTLQSALNTGLDKWIAQRSRGVPPQHFKTIQNFLYNNLAQDRVWLQQRATENMLRRMGRISNETVAARQAVQDTITEFETRLPMLIPRGTRTGAMAFGGRQPNITPQTVAGKIINRQPLTRAEEQFRVNNRQAVEAVLQREAKPIVPPEPVTPVTPEVTETLPTFTKEVTGRIIEQGRQADLAIKLGWLDKEGRLTKLGELMVDEPLSNLSPNIRPLAVELREAVKRIPKLTLPEVTPVTPKVTTGLIEQVRNALVETDRMDEVSAILPDGTGLTGREFKGIGAFQHLAEGLPNVQRWLDAGIVRTGLETDGTFFIEIRGGLSPEQFSKLNKLISTVKNVRVDFGYFENEVTESFEGTPNIVRGQLRKLIGEPGFPVGYAEPVAIPKAEAVTPTAPAVARPEPVERAEVPAAAPPSGVPPAEPPAGATTPPMPEPAPASGRPRTLLDLNREAKGMRALTPEQRAMAMEANKPIATDELLYQMRPFKEHADNLLGKDTPIQQVLRNTPGLKQATELWKPAEMERNNPAAMIGVRKGIFEEIEVARARLAVMRWWHEAEELFGFKRVEGEIVATKVQPASGVDTKAPWFGRIWDIVEHPADYVLTDEQIANLKIIQDVFNQNLRDNQKAGVNVVEMVDAYWKRIVLKEPSGKPLTTFLGGRVGGAPKGWTRQRKFDDVRELIKAGYKLETDPRIAAEDRLEAGIRTFSDQETRRAITNLPGVEKPLERMESRYPQTLEGARAARSARDEAKKAFLKSKSVEDGIALRQAEADYITAQREVFIKKIEVGQPDIGELKLTSGRIAPAELVDEVTRWVDLPEIRTGRGSVSNPVLQISQLLRTTLTNVDLAAGFIQGQVLFYSNNIAWWRAQGNTLVSLVDVPYAYVAKNFHLIDEGIRMGAVNLPTEFLFARRGLSSIPTRVPIVGPPMKAFNRAFEWFITTGQTELYRATRSGAIRRATGETTPAGRELEKEATDALVSLGSAIRKELGTESYAILGVRPTQHTIEQLAAFAARFFRALTGIMGQSFTGGEGGREARRAMGSLIAGGTALLIAVSLAKEKKMPNLTDPFAPDWMQAPIGKTYFSFFGPFYPYFRTIARASVYMARLRPDQAAEEIKRFLQSKAGIPLRAIDMLAQFGLKGEMRTFEGERIPRTILGVTRGVLGELAVPISIQEAMEAIPQGRPESAFAEVFGLVGRGSPYNQMDILFQKEKDINPEGQSYRYAEPWQEAEMKKRHPEIAKLLVGRGRGKWADWSEQSAEIDDVFFSQEEELARQFEAEEIIPDTFRQRYSEIQIERANQMIGVLKTLGMWGYGREVPKDRKKRLQYLTNNLPTDDMNERALAQYYLNFELAKDEAGILDWDVLEAVQDHFEKQWTEEQREYVEANTGLRNHPPLILEFIEARKQLKPYWELPELPRSIRESYRLWNPDIDTILVKWYGYKPAGQRRGPSQSPVPAGGRKLRLIKRK